MKAAVVKEYGTTSNVAVETIAIPKPGSKEVLVQIEAASVNPLDLKILSGQMQAHFPFATPYVAGTDFSGTIAELGNDVDGWKQGDRVFGRLEPGPGDGPQYSRTGAFAESVAVPVLHIARVPEGLDLARAAALPTAAGTAYQALFEIAETGPGQTVLIHGGAGGVGSFAIQLAKHCGAIVITTASHQQADFVRSLGADQVIDYDAEDFSTLLSNVDVVLDTVGGDVQQKSFAVLQKGGHLVTTISPPDQDLAMARGVTATWVSHQTVAERLETIAELWKSKHLKLAIAAVFPLAESRSALDKAAGKHSRGKILITAAMESPILRDNA